MKAKFVMIVAMCLCLTACGGTSAPTSEPTSETTTASVTESVPEETETETETEVETTVEETEAELSTDPDYDVKLLSYSLEKDDLGTQFLLVEYEYINHTDKAQNWTMSIKDTAYQNGVECGGYVISNLVDANMQLNDVKPETPYKLKIGYPVSDLSSPVTLECVSAITFVDYLPFINTEINLETMEATDIESTSEVKPDSDVEYEVKIISTSLEATDDNEPFVIVTYEFTHYQSDSTSFGLSVDDKVYQNGIECGGYIYTDKVDAGTELLDIKAGTPLTVAVAYPLQNTTDEITIECYKLLDFSSEPQPLALETVKLS